MSIRYFSDEPDYRAFCSALGPLVAPELGRRYTPRFLGDKSCSFFNAVMDCLDTDHMKYLRMVTAKQPAPDWHVVLFSEHPSDFDIEVAAPSLAAGIAQVLQVARGEDCGIDHVEMRNDGADLFDSDALVAKVLKIQFSSVDPSIADRVRTALKGVAVWDAGRAVSRLQSIPGFSDLSGELRAPPHYPYPMLPSLQNCAGALRAGLKRFLGIDIRLSKMQESMAKALGVKNWATLLAMDQGDDAYSVPYVLHRQQNDYGVREGQYFSCAATALAGMGAFCGSSETGAEGLSLITGSTSLIIMEPFGPNLEQSGELPCLHALSEASFDDDLLERAEEVILGECEVSEAIA